jgi:hypothetical protein
MVGSSLRATLAERPIYERIACTKRPIAGNGRASVCTSAYVAGVGEDRRPVREGQIRRQDKTLPFIAAAHDLEEEGGGAAVVREVAEFVQDEEPALAVVVQAPGETARGFLAAEVEEETGPRS